jgi:hypothetical protein
MISIDYVCGFANRLFQYSIANILSRHHGLYFLAVPINGIPQSYLSIEGLKLDGEPQSVETPSDVRDILKQKIILRPLKINGLFQKASLYLNHRSEIRDTWLKLDSSIPISELSIKCDLVIHVRRGDYLLHNWGAPFSFYLEAIESTTFRKMCIVTDDPFDPFLKRFHKFKPSIVSSSLLSDFALLTQAKKLIISPSTFSWWAAFLSNASEIFFPIPQHGIWSQDFNHKVDLTLPPEYNQYKYIRCSEALSLNAFERIYFEKKFLSLKLQKQGPTGYIMGHARSLIKISRQIRPWNS